MIISQIKIKGIEETLHKGSQIHEEEAIAPQENRKTTQLSNKDH